MAFYAVARGKNPGVYLSWEECFREVSGFTGAVYRKFTQKKEALDFIKENCSNDKVIAGPSPLKRKLSTDSSDFNNEMKQKVLERLHGIQEQLNLFCEKVANETREFQNNILIEMNCIREELSGVSQQPRKAILIDAMDASKSPLIARASSNLPCTSNNVPSGDSNVNTFRVDADGYVEVYTDGACSSNGYSKAKAGVGVWFGDGHSLNISEPVTGRITNNSAEIEAATMAIEAAKIAGVKKVKVYTDSAFLINAISKWIHKWRKNNWKTATGEPVKNKEELMILDQVRQNIVVKFEHVKGHNGIYENEQADALARAGAEKCIPKNKQ